MDENTNKYISWFRDLPDAAFVFRKNGEILAVNEVCCSLLGYDCEELLGLDMSEIDPGAVNNGIFGLTDPHLSSRWPLNVKRILERKDGYSVPVDIRVNKTQTGKDQFIAVVRDVGHDLLLERNLQHALKMEAIGTLAGGIAHDFNNILAAILGYGQIVKDQLPTDSSLKNDMDQILNGGLRATDLVKQILTFSRQGEEQLKPVKVQYLIKEVLKLLRASFPSTIKLEHYIDMKCGAISSDASQLHQVLMNLCTNAKDAIGNESGMVTVQLKDELIIDPANVAGAPLIEPGRYLILSVEDDGCGISESTSLRIFEPFFTTKDMNKGTGLGLAIVHGIVKKHQGDLVVSSTEGIGTIFRAFFPVVDGIEEEIEPVISEVAGGNEVIMVVDDESAVRIAIQRMLEREGYRVIVFQSSIEAVKAFRGNPAYYDMVITDMTMPEFTGAELAREFLSFREDIPILLMTGFSESIDRAKAMDLGIREFLLKPFSHRELRRLVRNVFDNG